MFFIDQVLIFGNQVVQLAQNSMNDCVGTYQQSILFLMGAVTNNKINKEMTDKFFSIYPKLKDRPPIQSVVEFICEDNFKDDIYNDTSNLNLWNKLASLKGEMIDFYTQNVCESNKGELFYEFHSKFYDLSLQLRRLRLVIQPEFHVIKNVHPVSKIPYLSVRGFWIDDNDKKVKVFTKSLGRVDSFVGGKNDSHMLMEAAKQIQQLSFTKYQEEYE
jgi:hypothetical protein